MLKVMQNLPSDVLGIEASGEVNHLDYLHIFIPEVEARLARGPIRMLFVTDPDFTGYALDARLFAFIQQDAARNWITAAIDHPA